MKLADIAQKTDAELIELLATARKDLAQAVIDARTKEVKNVKTQAGFKRTIARSLTILRQRELANEQTKEQTS